MTSVFTKASILPSLLFALCIMAFVPSIGFSDSATAASTTANSAQQPNIVLIISDDHDYDHFGFMDNSQVHTPELDNVARAGALFPTAHITMSRCHPSLATLLSGQWPHQSGIYYNFGTNRLSPENSLPQLLRDAGYATYFEGKYWEGDPRKMGFTHGVAGKQNSFVRDGQDELFSFIDEQAGKQPLFVWWAPKLPHTPHNPPDKYLKLFDREKIPVPGYVTAANRETFLEKEHISLAMEAWLDDGFGQLVKKLRDKNLYDNTLFVFLVDNGWCNGLVSKGSPFEKGIRTPIFFSWPSQTKPNQQFNQLVSSVDIYPTILDFANVEIPNTASGQSLRPLIEGKTKTGRQQLFGAIYPAFVTKGDERPERDIYALYVRDDRWKYILYLQDVVEERNRSYFRIQSIATNYPTRSRGDEDLYDLKNDPHELKNLAAHAEQSTRMANMRKAVLDWWQRTGGKPLDIPN